jgi:hypothetical protein
VRIVELIPLVIEAIQGIGCIVTSTESTQVVGNSVEIIDRSTSSTAPYRFGKIPPRYWILQSSFVLAPCSTKIIVLEAFQVNNENGRQHPKIRFLRRVRVFFAFLTIPLIVTG